MDIDRPDAHEQRRLRRARLTIYVFPIVSGVLTFSIAIAAAFAGINNQWVGMGAFVINTFLAGVASAVVVARLHPQERGKWWRAGTSFLFAIPIAFVTVAFLGMCAGLVMMLIGFR